MNQARIGAVSVLGAVGMMVDVALAAPVPGDASHSKALYESRCTACHSLDQSRIGPAHRGVYERHVASVSGYDYSPALKKSNVIWNARSLDRWLTNPEAFIPGQKMSYSVPDPKD